jgi:hypothetical protein
MVPLSMVFGAINGIDKWDSLDAEYKTRANLMCVPIIGAGIGGVAGVIYPISIPLYIYQYNEKIKKREEGWKEFKLKGINWYNFNQLDNNTNSVQDK